MAQPLISASTLRQFQDMSESMMDSEASLSVPGEWVDTGGGSGYFETTTVTFDCRLVAMKNQGDLYETLVAGRLDVSNVLTMHYPLSAGELSTEAALSVDGEAYEVIGTPPLGTYAAHRIALVRKVADGS